MNAAAVRTLTFLFSDIEDSAARWDDDADAMAPAFAQHDAMMRETLAAHGAHVFKTGDTFCAAFQTPLDAIAAAHAAQRVLTSAGSPAGRALRVRMAVHTGGAEERDGDYFGPTINRVARLLAAAHGGQVLVSGAAADAMQPMPPQITLRDLGTHRLRDLAHPEQVYQLVAEGLPDSFPALLSVDHLTNNLPAQVTSFVGRDSAIAEIKALIGEHRLVTLTGTGGAGKTRCAQQIGTELLASYADGVWLVELAPVSDAALVADALAKTLSVQEYADRPTLDAVLSYLKRKRLLLILDNCEHVLKEARRIAAAVLRDCPQVRILATSREPLNGSGEVTYRMPSLPVPAAEQLFADRAVLVNSRFAMTEENARHVGEICRRLDGIPFAIELAAARVKVLTPKQLAEKLNERFRVLTGGDRSVLPRHQTMRASIDWSYDLLSGEERTLLRTLSIFSGGFTRELAQDVYRRCVRDGIAVDGTIESLVDKSLVQSDRGKRGTRYALLESTRQYLREKLQEAGEEQAAARAHALAFVAFGERLDEAWDSTPDRLWFERAEPELDNFRAALTWAFGPDGDALLGQRLATCAGEMWMHLSTSESWRWIERAKERIGAGTPATVLVDLDLAEARLAGVLAQNKTSLAAGERALARCRALDDPARLARAERQTGSTLASLGRLAESEPLLRSALKRYRARNARKAEAGAMERLGWARSLAGDSAGARALYAQALAAAREAGAILQVAWISLDFAESEFMAGDANAAMRLADEALAISRSFKNRRSVTNLRCNQAAYLIALARFDEARLAAREALTVARDAQHPVGLVFAMQHLATIAALSPQAAPDADDPRRAAARILGYVDAQLESLHAQRELTERNGYEKTLAALREALGPDDLAKLMQDGSLWSEERAVTQAMSI